MKACQVIRPDARPFSTLSLLQKESKDLLCYTLFKPPKNDTHYFYYTEVLNMDLEVRKRFLG